MSSGGQDLRKQRGVKVINDVTEPIPVSASIDTSGLALETKQDVQIANQGTEPNAPPFGTKMLGWLSSIWERLNQFSFTSGSLDVNITANATANKGATPDVNTIALTDVSAVAVAAESDRKQVIILNATNKTIWIYYGTPAVFGTGIELVKGQIIVEDVYTGQITAIMDTGQTGNIEVTEVTT